MKKIRCTGRDGLTREFEYQYTLDELDGVWHFFVSSNPRPPSNQTFDMTFTPIDENTLRQTSIMNYNEPAYKPMGIPDAMLPEVKAVLGKEIESSPPEGIEPGVFRSIDADKMWKRLQGKGMAVYDQARKVYRLV